MNTVNITTLNDKNYKNDKNEKYSNGKYSFEFKMKLKDRIENITDKYYIERIKEIIFKDNLNLCHTKNSSGVLLFFHNLTEETYSKLESYLSL
jgi:hypothetical protein